MPRTDYERPAWYQIDSIYQCENCNHEQIVRAGFSAIMPCPMCGGYVSRVGESYPGNVDDWDEVRSGYDINGEWVRKSGRC